MEIMVSNLRVLHVVPLAPTGGTSNFIKRQVDQLSASGIKGELVFLDGSAMLSSPKLLPKRIAMIRRELKAFKPNIVHAHWGSLLAFISALVTIGGPPLVITFRGSDINPVPSESRFRNIVRITCSQLAARLAVAVICVSDELCKQLWFKKKIIRIIPDGTDLSLFRPIDKLHARRLLKWSPDEPVVIFYEGGRPKVKRRDLAEASMNEVRKSIGNCKLKIIGTGIPYEQIPLLLNASDCFLMTSDYEGSPNIIREALACNTPIVSVDVGDVRKWLIYQDATRIVARNPVEIGKNIVDIISTGIRYSMNPAGLKFSDESSNNYIIEIYNRIIKLR